MANKAANMYGQPAPGKTGKGGGKAKAIAQYEAQRPVPEDKPQKVSGRKAS